MSGRWAAAVLCVVLAAWARPARSAEPPTPDARAEALRLDAAAKKLAKSGSLREAIASLQRSQELVPRPGTLKRIAELQREAKDFGVAYTSYVALRQRFEKELGAWEKKEVDRAIQELAAVSGSLHVTAAGLGEHVELDGAPLGDGPLDVTRRVNLGPHTVRGTKENFVPFEKSVDVGGQAEVTVAVELTPLNGFLSVRMRGAPQHVFIDGKDVGVAPFEGELPPGPHEVRIGDPPDVVKRVVELAPGRRADLELEGETRGKLVVSTRPPGARILVDGEDRGVEPWTGKLPPGRHVVVASLEGYDQATAVVDSLAVGETHAERLTLTATPKPPGVNGVYALIGAKFAASPSSSNSISDACALRPTTCVGSAAAFGGAIPVRVGYSFGWFGIEGASELRYDQLSQSVDLSHGDSMDFIIWRFAFVNGIGVRFMPPTQRARFSAGAALGWLHESVHLFANPFGGAPRVPEPSASADAPTLVFDAGLLVGSTPGLKLRIGMELSLEFLGDGAVDKSTAPMLTLARGTTVFLGPVVGVQIGH